VQGDPHTPGEPRTHPLWLRVLLNACGPLGLGATLLGIVRPVLGLLIMAVGVAYILWELYPSAQRWKAKNPRMLLLVCICCGAALGFVFWWFVPQPSAAATNNKPAHLDQKQQDASNHLDRSKDELLATDQHSPKQPQRDSKNSKNTTLPKNTEAPRAAHKESIQSHTSGVREGTMPANKKQQQQQAPPSYQANQYVEPGGTGYQAVGPGSHAGPVIINPERHLSMSDEQKSHVFADLKIYKGENVVIDYEITEERFAKALSGAIGADRNNVTLQNAIMIGAPTPVFFIFGENRRAFAEAIAMALRNANVLPNFNGKVDTDPETLCIKIRRP